MCDRAALAVCKILLMAAIIWFMLGAPLPADEWADVPHRVSMMISQLPARMQRILLLWR